MSTWDKYLVILILGLILNHGAAQDKLFKQYKFHRLDESHGLSNNVVNDIIQDSLGQIWVATNEGLFRYQSFGFQQFLKARDKTHLLHNNFVERLYLDGSNNVWLMTDDGVGKYSYQSDVVSRYLPDQINGRISSIAESEDGTQYFGKYDSGILQVKDGQVTELNLLDKSSGLNFSKFSILYLTLDGQYLWALVGTIGVIRYDLVSEQIVYFSARDLANRGNLQQFEFWLDDDGRGWLTTEVSVYGLEVAADDSTKIIDRGLEQVLPVDDYLTIYIDDQKQMWLGSRFQGFFTVDIQTNNYHLLSHYTNRPDEFGTSSNTISKIYKEQKGNFWLGTHNGGINVFNPNGEIIRESTEQYYESDFSLAYNRVWGTTELNDGTILVGTDGAGVSLFDPASGHIQNNIFPELSDKAILAATLDSKDRLWLGTYAHGVYVYDQSFRLIHHFSISSPNSIMIVNDIRCFYETENGIMYIGTNQGGLYYYDENSQGLVLATAIPNWDIRSIASVGDGIMWLGTYSRGVIKYNWLSDKVLDSQWSKDEVHAKDVVFDMYLDQDTLWVATRHNAVVAFDIHQDKFLELPELDFMAGRTVSAIQKDAQGNLWMTLNTGVVCFSPSRKLVWQFSSEDGFQRGHFNFGSILLSNAGFLVLGGIHGMNTYYPEDLLNNKSNNQIILNQLKVFNQVVNPVNSEIFPDGESIFLTDRIKLSHTDNIFSIQYSYPGFTAHREDDFVYMLQNYDKKWQYGAESNEATYRNVPPGKYIFKVKSVETGVERSLAITVEPPLWKTWQAYVLYLLVLILIIWRLNRFSHSRLALRQKLEFEQELREKESAAMQEKLRFYTNFSHELKTPLTLIQGPVNDLMQTAESPQHIKYLRLIKKNTNVILRFINRMLEFRKIEMNKTTLNVGYHDIKILAQEEAESFGYLAKEKEIKFGFYCQNELEVWIDLEKIQIVMNNLLSNAFKFTPVGKAVNFGVFEENGYIIIEVKDQGVGIANEELKNIFSPFFQASNSYSSGGTGIGLALSKSFVELHGGTIEVESDLNVGTVITVRIPRGKEKYDQMTNVRFIDSAKKEAEILDAGQLDEEEVISLKQKESEKMILVVDDNKDIAAYIESIFESEYNVVKAENGLEAYDLAIKNTPDVIVSDLMMPGMDGLEFCEKIKANIATSHIPLIMVTAKDSKHDKVKGYEVGVDGYITKPFSSEVLFARVSNLLKNRELLEIRYESNDLIDIESTKSTREAEFVLNAEKITLQMLEQSEFSVPQLCKELGMSQSALYRKIKSLTGVSIQVFIRKIRIKRAAQLLLSEDMTVTEVAFSLEFADLKYFRKCFKEQFGKSPSEYRAEQLEKAEDTVD